MKFREALLDMLDSGELERIYNFAGYFEKKKVKHDIEMIKAYGHKNGTFIPLLNSLKSDMVLKTAIIYLNKE